MKDADCLRDSRHLSRAQDLSILPLRLLLRHGLLHLLDVLLVILDLLEQGIPFFDG